MDHNKIIRKEFSKQAAHFDGRGLTLSSHEILDWIVAGLPLDKDAKVLDVAAGTGHLSRTMALHVREVVAIDITPEMLDVARAETAKAGLTNITIEEGDAAQLPYADNEFDLVASRLAIHHFDEPIVQLREMVRVCKPGSKVAVVDLLSPTDHELAEIYNHLERLRDSSHAVALSEAQMIRSMEDAGLLLESVNSRDVEVNFKKWVEMTGPTAETMRLIETKLLSELNSGTLTGMRPFMSDATLKFTQVWAIFVGIKEN